MHLVPARARRALSHLAVGGVLVLGSTALGAHSAGADANSDTWSVVATLQAERAWFHLPPLAVDPNLVRYATYHSEQMAAAHTIFHSASLLSVAALVPGWQEVGENVGMGPNWSWVAYAFAHSPEHLSNILGNYNRVGVGVVDTSTGVYVTEEFARAPY